MRRILQHCLFVLLAGWALFFTTEIIHRLIEAVDKPFVSFSCNENGYVNPASLEVWGARDAGFRPWDKVLRVNDREVSNGAEVRAQALANPPPQDIQYSLRGVDGEIRNVMVRTRIFSVADIVRSHASQAFLGFLFIAIAVLLYIARPGSVEGWAFFFLAANIGISLSAVVNETLLFRFAPLYNYIMPFLPATGLVLVGALSRSLVWRRLRHGKELFLRRILIVAVVVAFLVSSVLSVFWATSRNDIYASLVAEKLMYSWLALGVFVDGFTLFVAYRVDTSSRRKARLRQILWAVPVGAGIPTLNLLVGSLFDLTTVSFLWNGFLVVLPLVTADAIVRHDLLQLNIMARRIVGGITVAAVMGIGLGFALWLSSTFFDLTEVAETGALAALLFALAAPVSHRVQKYVERLLWAPRYEAGQIAADFMAAASTSLELSDLTPRLLHALDKSVAPTKVEFFRIDRDEDLLIPLMGEEKTLPMNAVLTRLLSKPKAEVYDDEDLHQRPLPWAVLALRLAVANDPVGLLILGHREESLTYSEDDVAFIESLSGPLGAALINARAYADVQRLNQDLEERVLERTKALARSNEELEDLNSRKDDLVATVSHDFRTPLAVIRQNVQTIVRDLTSIPKADLERFLLSIGRQEQRLTTMSESLLDLARLKQLKQHEELVDIAGLAEELVMSMAPVGSRAQVDIEYLSKDEVIPLVKGTSVRLQQLLQNLVENGVKFTEAGGKVIVHTGTFVREQRKRVFFSVSDTGCGIPRAHFSRLFEPFYQIPRQSHVGQGSGLGLAIVKAVVDSHGGTIDVDSDSSGTKFTIELPAHEEDARNET